MVIYYCVFDFEQLAEDREALRRVEDEVLDEADLVFVNGRTLRDRFAGHHPRVRIYPFGVNATTFSAGRAAV